ncbi:hypothetical protein AB4K20DRAFT_1982517 [Rhizopus microsporus]
MSRRSFDKATHRWIRYYFHKHKKNLGGLQKVEHFVSIQVITFNNATCIIIAGKLIFFNSLRLDTVDGTYKYFQHGEVSLPSFESTTTDMKAFLESMLSFKERIKESLASEEEEKLPPLFDEYSHFIKPTIALKDGKEKYVRGTIKNNCIV